MLRKSLILFCALMLIIAGTAQAQDANLEIEITVHQPDLEKNLTAAVAFREHDTVVLSDLFPSFAVVFPETINPEVILCLFPSGEELSLDGIAESVARTAAGIQTAGIPGLYSGDLFDDAQVLQTGSMTPEDFLASIRSAPDYGENPVFVLFDAAVSMLLATMEEADLSGVEILHRVFDGGKYLCLNLTKGDETLATASFDFSQDANIRAVFGYAENGKNYYWNIEMNESAENQIQIRSALFSDAGKRGFRSVRNGAPVLETSWTLSLLPTLREIVANGMFVPSNGLDPIILKGVFSAKETPALSMDLHFNGTEENILSVVVKAGSTTPDLTDRTILSIGEMSSPETIAPFTSEISLRFLSFYSVFIQAIPEGYLQLFTMLD
jgi:hypothetical protein